MDEVVHRLDVAKNVGCKLEKTSVGDGVEDDTQMVVANSRRISGRLAIDLLYALQVLRNVVIHMARGRNGFGDGVGQLGCHVALGLEAHLEWLHSFIGEAGQDIPLREKAHGGAKVEVER